MRLSRLPAVLVAGALLAGMSSCSTTIDGTGTAAADVTGGPDITASPTAESTSTPTSSPTSEPTSETTTASPTPAPTTANPVVARRRLLCVLERAAITSINSQFNKSKDRDAQLRILRTGATTIRGHLVRSGLADSDPVRRAGTTVRDELNRLVTLAGSGGSPSTAVYNRATQRFQTACNNAG